jgi:cytosine/adenosine deaminase-related metal-dependent hydrolase
MTNEIGSIEPDKQADIVLRHAQLPELYPGIHPVRNAMLGLRSKGVDTVIVNGDIVLEGGHLTRFDEEEAFRVSRERARALMHRVGLGSPGI